MEARRTWIVVIPIVSVLLLSGCWDRTEVNDLAILTAGGLDLTEDRKLELSVKQYLISPSSSEQSGSFSSDTGGGSGKSVLRSSRGVSMADAESHLQQVLSRKVFWGQDEVFVFGQRLAKEGLAEPMEFLTRHPIPRERANVFVSQSPAKEVLELDPPIERSVSQALRKMAENETGLNITMKELAEMMAGRSRSAVIPWVEIKPGDGKQAAFAHINGTAVLKNGKMIGRMNDAETRGIMWLRNEVKKATVTVSPGKGKGLVSLQLLRSRTELIPHIEGSKWSLTVRIETRDDIIENTSEFDLSLPDHMNELERELEDDIKRRIQMALRRAQKEMKSDIFNFADAFYRKYPREWNRNKGRWDDLYSNLEINVQAKVKVVRPGLTNKSIFKPEQR
ncbi:spore gernimation protein GerC [Gordoniibacillus kamchatkensis]|uniref:Spore gernimation protein GerC n=1 Tax=Gordoniibacillus kamchatkensis TaxID=1590651 RepID=A0ABR5AED1_9BACL|nr:Ger(x)C family spore germination protein [Paenibacillus sp. VKM B-2647]KIL39364.1 spore gernimation protein GerC [Paenibacillus sp. VKM B-2647]